MIKYTLIGLQILFIVRFHLELSRANPHTQPASIIRKMTNPFVLPLKRFLPFALAKKVSALIIAYAVAALVLLFATDMKIAIVLKESLLWLIQSWIFFLQYGIFIYVIGSWVRIPALEKTNTFFHFLFEPILAPIRRFVPAFMGIDFSPMILLIGLPILTNMLFSIFNA